MRFMNATGIILAGGRSLRFGTNKALAPWQNKTLLEWLVSQLGEIFPKVIVAAKCTHCYTFLRSGSVSLAKDPSLIFHPLSGFEAGLKVSSTEANFITACDMPFVNKKLIFMLWKEYEGHKVCICRWGEKMQPFFGFYSKKCLSKIQRGIKGNFSLETVLKSLEARFLSQKVVRCLDPEGVCFKDIDTRKDYDKARKLNESLGAQRAY